MRIRTHVIPRDLAAVVFLGAFLVAPAARAAGQASNPPAEEKAKVIGHLALPGIHVNQMFVQHEGKKDYLYLHRPNKRAFAVVDVTKPERPVLLEKAALQGPAREQVGVSEANPSLGIATTPEDGAGANGAQRAAPSAPIVLPTETVKILDLSDPAHPRVLKTFTGVTSMLPDDGHKLIYVVNGEGLWIVRHRQSQPMPYCTSEDALMQDPNCQ
jgi:hypothetical protein